MCACLCLRLPCMCVRAGVRVGVCLSSFRISRPYYAELHFEVGDGMRVCEKFKLPASRSPQPDACAPPFGQRVTAVDSAHGGDTHFLISVAAAAAAASSPISDRQVMQKECNLLDCACACLALALSRSLSHTLPLSAHVVTFANVFFSFCFCLCRLQ